MKSYLTAVIVPGALALAWAVANWDCKDPVAFAIYCAIGMVFAVVKLRLPAMAGTYSLSFVPVLYGIDRFSAPEVVVAAVAAAVTGSVLAAKRRPGLAQVLFNSANLTVSATVCLAAYHLLRENIPYLPALLCVMVTLYFAVNTALVSGIISLSGDKRVGEVCEAWYLWSFIYYLAGATALGLAMSSAGNLQAWIVLIPVGYMIWFFWSLRSKNRGEAPAVSNGSIPARAKGYIVGVLACGVLLLAGSVTAMPAMSGRFLLVLAAAVIAAAGKVRLPGMTGTVSTSFVVILYAASELALAETLLIGIAAALVQSYWKARRPPQAVQVAFNAATVALSAGAAYATCHGLVRFLPAETALLITVLAGTAVYYMCNTALVCTVLGLIESKPMAAIWQTCRFWSLPYYLVGTAVTGVMAAVGRTAGTGAAMLTLSIMALVYLAYAVHMKQARLVAAAAPAA